MSFFGDIFEKVAAPLTSGLFGLGGSLISSSANSEAGSNNAALQREFAQHGIRWKVEDAKAAGINPLFALGAPFAQAAPAYVGDTSMGSAVAGFGQDISRAIDSTRTTGERNQARMDALTLENAGLQNDVLRSQLAKLNSSQVGPAFPGTPGLIDGQGNSGIIDVTPSRVVTGAVGAPSRQPGVLAEYQLGAPRSNGSQPLYPSKDAKERIEDDIVGEVIWALQNRLVPERHPDPDMYWNPLFQSYRKNPIPRSWRFIPAN